MITCVNQSGPIDSKFALDTTTQKIFYREMDDVQSLQVLVLDRCDPQQNMQRFYVLSIEPTLFGDSAVLRQWGRHGTRGCEKRDLYATTAAAREALDEWLRRKSRRGYKMRNEPQA